MFRTANLLRTVNSFDELSRVFRGFDSFFNDALGNDLGSGLRLLPAAAVACRPAALQPSSRSGYPAVEVVRDGDNLVFRAELPGVSLDDLEVNVADGRLTVRGEKKEKKDADVFYRELYRGSFERSFVLPKGVKTDEIQARFHNGVLTVTLPGVAAREGARRVPIRIEGGKSDTPKIDKKSS